MPRYIKPQDVLRVQDPSFAYGMNLIESARQGVSRADFVDFAKRIKRSVQSLARIIPASYSSLSKKQSFDLKTSERILAIAEVYALGIEVFGDIDRFNHWLNAISLPLGGKTPFSILDTSFGIELVKKEIGRIDHGIFA